MQKGRNVAGAATRLVESSLASIESRGQKQDWSHAYVNLLRRCVDSGDCKTVHQHLVKHGYGDNALVANSLVQMYTRSGNLEDARAVFESCSSRDRQSWGGMIRAYAKNGRKKEALELYNRMERTGVTGDCSVFAGALGACHGEEDLEQGRAIHAAILAAYSGRKLEGFLATALCNMYGKCGNVEEAKAVFDNMPEKEQDIVCYTIMISAYAQKGHYNSAIEMYKEMDARGIEPNAKTFACVLSACSGLKSMDMGRAVHKRIVDNGIEQDVVLQNALLNMYAKCGDLDESRRLFQQMPRKNVSTWNSMISAYVQHEHYTEALGLYREMNMAPTSYTFASILGACCSPEALEDGKAIHKQILASGPQVQSDQILQNALVTMYAKCGSVEDAYRIFQGIRKKSVFSWTAIITGCIQHAYYQEGLDFFRQMVSEGKVEPDIISYASAIRACASLENLEEGLRIQRLATSRGIHSPIVDTALVALHGTCGDLEAALQIFQDIQDRDLISWSAIISSCHLHQDYGQALSFFKKMELEGVRPSSSVLAKAVVACSNLGLFEEGKALHARAECLGLEDEFLQDCLLCMYSKCGRLDEAREIFEGLARKTVVSWTTMIGGYNQHDRYTEALELYHAMDIEPDEVTYASVLTSCTRLGDLEEGRAAHKRLASTGIPLTTFVQTALMEMYVRLGDLAEARKTFDTFDTSNIGSWTSIIWALAEERQTATALEFYRKMDLEGMQPNIVTYCSILSACAISGFLDDGRAIHARVTATGHISNTAVHNSVVYMYSKCGRLDLAKQQFDSIPVKTYPSWRIMLGTYSQLGYPMEALVLYRQMNLEGIKLGGPVFAAAVAACTMVDDLQLGREIHARAAATLTYQDLVLQNCLVNMYAKCGGIDEARLVFDETRDKNGISWGTMLGGYYHCQRPEETLKLYKLMDKEPTPLCLLPVLTACGDLGRLEEGKAVHARLAELGFETRSSLLTALVNMYARCGKLQLAREFFNRTFSSDVGAWNCMATAYAQFGNGMQVLDLYHEMCLQGVQPNAITLMSVLVACSHMGMLEVSKHHFESMISDFGLSPVSEHYSCMTDLLGRSGKLDEAEKVVAMVSQVSSNLPTGNAVATSAWTSFLGACKIHNDTQRAARAAEKLYELDPGDTVPYILLSQTYEQAERESA